jgi:hypothetical protein
VTEIGELEATSAVTSNQSTLRRNTMVFIIIVSYLFIIVIFIIFKVIKYYIFLSSVLRLLVTAIVDPISLILFTLILGAIISSETSVHTIATLRSVPKDGMLHNINAFLGVSSRDCIRRGALQ